MKLLFILFFGFLIQSALGEDSLPQTKLPRTGKLAGMEGLFKVWFVQHGVEEPADAKAAAKGMIEKYPDLGAIEKDQPALFKKMKPFLGQVTVRCDMSLAQLVDSMTASTPRTEIMDKAYRKLNNVLNVDNSAVKLIDVDRGYENPNDKQSSKLLVVDREKVPEALRADVDAVIRDLNNDGLGEDALQALFKKVLPLDDYIVKNFADGGPWANYKRWGQAGVVNEGKSESLLPTGLGRNNPGLTRANTRRRVYRKFDDTGRFLISVAETLDRQGRIRRREVIEDVYDAAGIFQFRRVAARDYEKGTQEDQKGTKPTEKTTCLSCHSQSGGRVENSFLAGSRKSNVITLKRH